MPLPINTDRRVVNVIVLCDLFPPLFGHRCCLKNEVALKDVEIGNETQIEGKGKGEEARQCFDLWSHESEHDTPKSYTLGGVMRVLLLVPLLFVPLFTHAQEPASFTDVPPTREEFVAVEDLHRRGILEGRPDGTFGPDDPVNRAEAVTIVVRAVANVRNLPDLANCFPDVQTNEWFVQTVCYAADLEWISGYPDGTFQPVRKVLKAEFLKILINAYGIDTAPLEAFRDRGLAPDAADIEQWYFPYLAYALASSMTHADTFGNLNPGSVLTRGQVALLTHRFLLYREGKRVQSLLTDTEQDIRLTFGKIDAFEIGNAEFGANRVRIMAYGASARLPEELIVKATVTLSQGLAALVEGYALVERKDFGTALSKSQEAYRLADRAEKLEESLVLYTEKIRSYSHDLAEQIRSHGG